MFPSSPSPFVPTPPIITNISSDLYIYRPSGQRYMSETWPYRANRRGVQYRNDPNTVQAVELAEVLDPAYNAACPLKMLLVHALRTGAVAETSWQELRRNAIARPNKMVVWKTPERPVICAITTGGGGYTGLQLDRPSCDHTMTGCLRAAADAAGLIRQPIPHDLRRGAAYEHASLVKSKTITLESARVMLGHSLRKNEGLQLTSAYVGHNGQDTWTPRLETAAPKRVKHKVELSAGPRPKKKRSTKQEVGAARESLQMKTLQRWSADKQVCANEDQEK